MPVTPETLKALIDAQFELERAERVAQEATIRSTCLTPSNVSSDQLSEWRDQETQPSRIAVELATAERDRCLAEIGWTRDVWSAKMKLTIPSASSS